MRGWGLGLRAVAGGGATRREQRERRQPARINLAGSRCGVRSTPPAFGRRRRRAPSRSATHRTHRPRSLCCGARCSRESRGACVACGVRGRCCRPGRKSSGVVGKAAGPRAVLAVDTSATSASLPHSHLRLRSCSRCGGGGSGGGGGGGGGSGGCGGGSGDVPWGLSGRGGCSQKTVQGGVSLRSTLARRDRSRRSSNSRQKSRLSREPGGSYTPCCGGGDGGRRTRRQGYLRREKNVTFLVHAQFTRGLWFSVNIMNSRMN